MSRDGGPERETKGKSWRQRNAVTEETAACEALAGQEAGHRRGRGSLSSRRQRQKLKSGKGWGRNDKRAEEPQTVARKV